MVFLHKLVAFISLCGGRLCGKNDSVRGSYFRLCGTAFTFARHARLLAIVVNYFEDLSKIEYRGNSVCDRGNHRCVIRADYCCSSIIRPLHYLYDLFVSCIYSFSASLE